MRQGQSDLLASAPSCKLRFMSKRVAGECGVQRGTGTWVSAKLGLRALVPVFGLCVLAGGCAKPAQVHVDELPVQRVVVYRNGVAYFERAGSVDGEQVRFTLRKENVGDFLATLAILEAGGSTVKAASFPVELEEEEEDAQIDPSLQKAMDAWEGKKPEKRPGLRVVTLELDGKHHDLTVGYLAETPVWRPSYRLVVGDKGQAELQAWGIVQNQSGEDWKNVELALVAGAPIAFASNLGDPVVPPRPVVTDSGEIISAVPEGETSYHQESDDAPPAPAAEPAPAEEKAMADGMAREEAAQDSSAVGNAAAGPPAAPKPTRPGMGAAVGRASSAEAQRADKKSRAPALKGGVGAVRDSSRLAQVAAQTGSTRYDVPVRVTIPDQSATMVLLVSKTIPGEAVYLYAPDGGVPESSSHPFRVVRFKNESGGLLEKGPIAVFEKGAFLGQGLMESLPLKGAATVPFALVRGLSVQPSYSSDQRGSRLYSVSAGQLMIERDQASLTTYEVQNGEKDKVRLLVRHPRNPQAKLWSPPAGTEEDLASGVALVPMQVPGFGKAKLVVEERYPIQMHVDWRSLEARSAIEGHLASAKASAGEKAVLQNVLAASKALAESEDRTRRLSREQQELEKATRETRLSIQAIEKNQNAAALRAELTERLRKNTARLDQITKEVIEVGLRQSEQEVRLKEATQGLVIAPPDRR